MTDEAEVSYLESELMQEMTAEKAGKADNGR
jgi:hypothetical protein